MFVCQVNPNLISLGELDSIIKQMHKILPAEDVIIIPNGMCVTEFTGEEGLNFLEGYVKGLTKYIETMKAR